MELPDGLERSRRRFGASKNNQICAAHGRHWFPKPARRQQGFPSQWPRRVHQKNVQVAGELEMLKTIIQEKNVDGLPRFESPALGEAVLAHAKGDAALQTEFHQLDFVTRAI